VRGRRARFTIRDWVANLIPELVQEGFVFTEGPVGTADGGLYFSDIRVSKTYHLDPAGKITVIREGTGGANGIALTKDGELLFAEGEAMRITRLAIGGRVVTLTEGPEGTPLLAPNDLIADASFPSCSRLGSSSFQDCCNTPSFVVMFLLL